MERALPTPTDERTETRLQLMWGDALRGGFVAVPNVLVTSFKDFDVTPTEFLVLLNIMVRIPRDCGQ